MVSPESVPVRDQSGRTFVITGANSGLGFEVAKRVAEAGAHVVLACRNTTKAAEAAGRIDGSTEVRQLDTSSLESVRAFADVAPDRIDVLVNNAGVMAIDEARSDDGFELQFATNYLGAFALTARLLPRLTDRVVMLSSVAHLIGRITLDDLQWRRRRYSRWGAYGQSKLADLMFAYDLQSRFAEARSPLRAVAAHPGLSSTNLTNNMKMPPAVRTMSAAMLQGLGQSAPEGSLSVLLAATAPDLPGGSYVGPSGPGEVRGAPMIVGSSRASRNRALQRLLTAESARLTGVDLVIPT